MTDLKERITELAMDKFCCSQIILAIGCEYYGLQNEGLIKAAKGLCGGLHTGLVCGTLSGACCLISLVLPIETSVPAVRILTEWFSQRYGNTDCYPILEANPEIEETNCIVLVEETLDKTLEIIDESLGK